MPWELPLSQSYSEESPKEKKKKKKLSNKAQKRSTWILEYLKFV